MKYAVEISSDAIIYVSFFIKIGSGIQKLTGGYTDTQTAWASHKSTFIFQNKESKLKMYVLMDKLVHNTVCISNHVNWLLMETSGF
jgi:hypothetical protein